jgi:voltage-gated potassium channel
MQQPPQSKEGLGLTNIIIIVFSIYVLGALIIETVYKLPRETSHLLNYIDNVICCFFFLDFCIRFKEAENKWKYMKWGWIDLISCIPTIDALRAGRLLRLIRLIRVIRAFKSTKHLIDHVFKNRAKGVFTSVAVLAILIIIFSAIAILQVETDPNSNIKNAEDAL